MGYNFKQGPGGLLRSVLKAFNDSSYIKVDYEAFDTDFMRDVITSQCQKGLCFILAVVIRNKNETILHQYYDGIKLNKDLFGKDYVQNKIAEIFGSKEIKINYYEISYLIENQEARLICSLEDFFSSCQTKRDYVRVFLSAQENFAPAQFALANMFFEKNYKYQGMYWLKKAAAHGHIIAKWGLQLLSNCDCNCFDLKEFESSP